jgi:DNA polymerase III delta prime subunit
MILFQVSHTKEGLEAIVFTAQGDMRQALNNLQSTFNGFGHVSGENVFKVRYCNYELKIYNLYLFGYI